jgi:hypothetical protein
MNPAPKTFLTDIYMLKDLAGDRNQQERGGNDRTRALSSDFTFSRQSGWAVYKGMAIEIVQHQEILSQNLFGKQQQAQI